MIGFIASIVPLLSESLCSLEYTLFILFTTMTTTNLAWKCWKIYGIFTSSEDFDTPKCSFLLKKKGQLSINIFSQITVLFLLFLNLVVLGPGWVRQDYQATPHDVINPICTVTKETVAMVTAIIPVLLFSLILAFRMRLFPHNFRETLNIFTATLIVLLCCVMFLTGYTLADPLLKALLRAIVMFLASMAFLLSIFLPRIMILIAEGEERNERNLVIQNTVRHSHLVRSPHMCVGITPGVYVSKNNSSLLLQYWCSCIETIWYRKHLTLCLAQVAGRPSRALTRGYFVTKETIEYSC
eukprot:sb/3467429/